jgi:two-component system NarL family sensor kinase
MTNPRSGAAKHPAPGPHESAKAASGCVAEPPLGPVADPEGPDAPDSARRAPDGRPSSPTTNVRPTPVVLADGRRTARRRPGPSRSVWVRFGASTAIALAIVLAAGLALSTRAAEHEGVADVRHTTELLTSAVIEPQLSRDLLAGDPGAIAAMDELVDTRLSIPTDIVRVKIWDADGRIVYSDAHDLIGARYPLGDEELGVLRAGGTHAELSNLELSENRLERALGGRLLEVYSGLQAPDGTPLLLEAYYSVDDVNARRSELLWSFASITLLGLFVFAGFQLSLGFTTVRWLHRERDRLLDKAVKMSEDDRRRLASDLHDGVVQDLVGASYVLAGTAGELRERGEEQMAARLSDSRQDVRASIQRLRSMIVDLYPATLRTAGLEVVLSDLAAPLRLRGMDVQIDTPTGLALPEHAQTLVYRTIQEALRNVMNHALASRVTLAVEQHASCTRVEVTDDGIGFVPGKPPERGHIGLPAMADLARESGALLEVVSEPGHGTTVRLELPS